MRCSKHCMIITVLVVYWFTPYLMTLKWQVCRAQYLFEFFNFLRVSCIGKCTPCMLVMSNDAYTICWMLRGQGTGWSVVLNSNCGLNSFSFVNLRETMKLSLNYPGHLYRSVALRYWFMLAIHSIYIAEIAPEQNEWNGQLTYVVCLAWWCWAHLGL